MNTISDGSVLRQSILREKPAAPPPMGFFQKGFLGFAVVFGIFCAINAVADIVDGDYSGGILHPAIAAPAGQGSSVSIVGYSRNPGCSSKSESHPPSKGILISIFFTMGLGPVIAVLFVLRGLSRERQRFEADLAKWRERALLKAAASSQGRVTSGEFSLLTDMSMGESEDYLCQMAVTGRIETMVSQDGEMVYRMPGLFIDKEGAESVDI